MDLLKFLNDSVTPWHAAANLAKELQSQGFVPLLEAEPWKLSLNSAYFVQRGAAIFAFRTPSAWTPQTRFRLASAHTDFPALKITPNPDKNVAGFHLLHPEVYGAFRSVKGKLLIRLCDARVLHTRGSEDGEEQDDGHTRSHQSCYR